MNSVFTLACIARRTGFALGVAMVCTIYLAPVPASAATADSSIAVSSSVQATCVTTATPLAFGVYTGIQADNTATISVTCTKSTPYTVGLNAGLGTGATVTARSMTGAGMALNYALFTDAGRTTNWGNTVATHTVAGTATGAAQVLTVYGRVAAGQFVAPGAYNDTVTATVTY